MPALVVRCGRTHTLCIFVLLPAWACLTWPGKRVAAPDTVCRSPSCLLLAGFCDDKDAGCYCPSNTTYGRIPAPVEAPLGEHYPAHVALDTQKAHARLA